MKLDDIHRMNIDAVESERVRSVKYRAQELADGYLAIKATFNEVKRGDSCHVLHKSSRTEISPWTGHVNSIVKIRSFREREKGVYYHRSAPIKIIRSGYQAKLIIDWEAIK
ncbi:hypothetical protein OA46_04640 [Enterobacter cloacae]|nr:hypothetical protein OA46_04640 [Enterobacter cloacae]